MKAHNKNRNRALSTFLLFMSVIIALPAAAAPRCGTFEAVDVGGRILHMVPFGDGTAWAVGPSDFDPSIPVLRHFDGASWSEQDVPLELDGFAFSGAGGTPEGDAWFAATRAYSVYEIEVAFMRVSGGSVTRIDRMYTDAGAPLHIDASSGSDVWALTSAGDVFRFDGSGWTLNDVPAVFVDQRLNPKGIVVFSPDDVWIAGYGSVLKNTDYGYVQHWDGNTWSIVTTPYSQETIGHFFEDIDGSGPNDIWIAGSFIGDSILLHWDGNDWTEVASAGTVPGMSRVMSMAPGNAWALPLQSRAMYYWNGSTWAVGSELALPPEAVTVSVRDVDKAGVCDAWVVGDYHDGTAYHPWAARLVPGDVEVEYFVSAIDVSRVRESRKSYSGQALVAIHNTDVQPVAGAVVTGQFSGPTSEMLVGTTGPDGTVTFASATVNRPDGDWCFSVTDVVAPSGAYNASLNPAGSVCEGGDTGGGGKGGKGGGKGGKGKN